jgi:hypothetical protein
MAHMRCGLLVAGVLFLGCDVPLWVLDEVFPATGRAC